MYNTLTPVRDRLTTSRSVHPASHDTSDSRSTHYSNGFRGHRQPVIEGGDTTVKSSAVEVAAVEPTSVPSASASVGEIRLAEDSRAQ